MLYDETAVSYNELHGEEQLAKLEIIKNRIQPAKSARMLDVGCGTGISSGFGCFVVGVDSSIGMLKLNKNALKLTGMAEMLPLKSNSFDYVISITAMHNFDDVRRAISEIKRVGKSHFVLSVLKKSGKYGNICRLIRKNFAVESVVEEDKDLIFFCRKH